MQWATGFYDQQGMPRLRLHIAGGWSDSAGLKGLEFDAVINSSFTGFLSVPMVRSFPLRLSLTGATTLELPDGSNRNALTAWAHVAVGARRRWGNVVLDPAGQDVVAGREFLEIFEAALVLTGDEVLFFEDSPGWLEQLGDFQPPFQVQESDEEHPVEQPGEIT
jgi:hypothetical protein